MAKTFDEVIAAVTDRVRDVLDDQSVVLTYETTAADVPNWDSLSHIEIVVAIEKHFDIRFNFADLQRFRNVGEMCDNIVVKLRPPDAPMP